jgi:NADH:ubiquinone reductase (non-electrogenic)
VNNTFGIQGVKEHTMFFKTVEDAARLRLRVSECFERAALPATTPEVRAALPGDAQACCPRLRVFRL